MSQELAPPMRWLHKLYQVTGLISLKGPSRLTRSDYIEMIGYVEQVLKEMREEMTKREEDGAQPVHERS
jgi:hypothetical protein